MTELRRTTIEITGAPVAKGRGRAVSTSSGTRVITPEKTKKWEADARTEARYQMGQAEPFTQPLSISTIVTITPPKSWPNWKREAALEGLIPHTNKPDIDNVVKAAMDALNGIVYVDDALAYRIDARKAWGVRPSVWVLVTEVPTVSSKKEYENLKK